MMNPSKPRLAFALLLGSLIAVLLTALDWHIFAPNTSTGHRVFDVVVTALALPFGYWVTRWRRNRKGDPQ